MITETIYDKKDLVRDKCKYCGEVSSQIVKAEGICVDCLEEIKFIEESYRIMNEEKPEPWDW